MHLAAASGHLEVDFSRPSVTMTWTPSDDEHFHGDNTWESPDEPVDLGFFMVKIMSDSYHFQNPNQGAAIWFSPAIVNVCSSASHGCESTPFLVVEIHFYI